MRSTDPSLFAVVSPNGLGHLSRVTGVLAETYQHIPSMDVTLAITEKQSQSDVPPLKKIKQLGAKIITGVTDTTIRLEKDPSVYADGRLINWEDGLSVIPAFHEADLAWTDNMAGVAGLRGDKAVIGSGNFLWSDNLEANFPDSPAVAAFAKHERDVLERYPGIPWLCVSAIAMRSLIDQTDAQQVGWMTQNTTIKNLSAAERGRNVAVFGGNTSMADDHLSEAARHLIKADTWNVHLSPALREMLPTELATRAITISGDYNIYNKMAVVVGRPGAGLLNACIESYTPIISVNEDDFEIEHNGRRMAELDLGRYLGRNTTAIVDVAEEVIASKNIRQSLILQRRDGVQQSARIVADKLLEAHASSVGATSHRHSTANTKK